MYSISLRTTQSRRMRALVAAVASVAAAIVVAAPAQPVAAEPTAFDRLEGGPGSEAFGSAVTVLTNGNYVVVDPLHDAGGVADVGAVHLYDGATDRRISTLTGSSAQDRVGSKGVAALASGDFVVVSPQWSIGGGAASVGAVTHVDGVRGLDGVVTTANSLHGTNAADQVGGEGVTVLTNGNYVVVSPRWNTNATLRVGAVTFANGDDGITGAVTAENSLRGSQTDDLVGQGGVEALSNGNYVVSSPWWDDDTVADVGAATLANGTIGHTGVVTAGNSLHGSTAEDYVGLMGATALSSGNYVVTSPYWDNAGVVDVGAATFASGTSGQTGPVTAANSLHGTTRQDYIGGFGTTALTNGNYVVASPNWDHGTTADVGAATWGNGVSGLSGPVSDKNSLHGASTGDRVGLSDVLALTNGNYVVSTSTWDLGDVEDVGAATFGNGTTGSTGPVTTANSLHGTTQHDRVGISPMVALANGNFVVVSPSWDGPTAQNAGAVTFGNGTSVLSGPVTIANSLYGTSVDDRVGEGGAVALEEGGYLVLSRSWNNGSIDDAGAVTFGNRTTGVAGPVSTANSTYGTTAGDNVGDDAVALHGGGAVVVSARWDAAGVVDAGAATYVPGGGRVGPVDASNSAIGTPPGKVDLAGARLTTSRSVVVPTTQNQALLLRLDPPQAPQPAPDDLGIVTVTPGRLFETRAGESTVDSRQEGIGRRTAQQETVVEVAGRHGVPSSATAAMINVAVIDPDERGFVAAYPCGGDRPQASMLNYAAQQTVANGAAVELSADGTLCVYTHRAADMIVDITGYVPENSAVGTLVPGRLVETRPGERTVDGVQQGIGRRAAGQETVVQVAGRHGVPADAAAGVFNIAAVDADERGFIAAYPCGAERPGASMLNFAAGQTVANGGTIELSADGTLCVYTHRALDLIVDVTGWVADAEAISTVTPARLLETRAGGSTVDGQQQVVGRVAARQEVVVDVAGRAGVPVGATAAMVNVAVVAPDDRGFVTAYPCGSDRPTASMLNYAAGQIVANGATIKLSAEGTVCVYSHRTTDLIVDITGYSR